MIGAILGDIIGSPYEFDRGNKTKNFPLFDNGAKFTDDTVMTVAVAQALMDSRGGSDEEIRAAAVRSMREWGNRYPDAGFGGMFRRWLKAKEPAPYGSYGNGSAMRVSSAGWLFDTIEETRRAARLTAEVTHNHPEGVKGAEAAASAIFLARNGSSKEEIMEYIAAEFGYDLTRTCDEIRPTYRHDESCQRTVPEAITAFLEGEDFEDVIRTAVSLGGDCDTLTCIAGGIAEAFYGVPEELAKECERRIPGDMLAVISRFREMRREPTPFDPFLMGNDAVEKAIEAYYAEGSREAVAAVLNAVETRMRANGHFIVPFMDDEEEEGAMLFRFVTTSDGRNLTAVFTSYAEFTKGEGSKALSYFIDELLKMCVETGSDGLIINPWGRSFMLPRELIELLLKAHGEI